MLLSFSYSIEDFYPRSPCGERHLFCPPSRHNLKISIHALLAESDVTGTAKCFALNAFLSTLSLRRATWRAAFQRLRDSYFYPRSPCGERPFMGTNTIGRLYISIHALLAESDAAELTTSFFDLNFYPRSPCGERPKFLMMLQSSIKFLSTLSLRRATPRLSSPLWGQENFYPRSPCGERPSSGTALLA